MIARPPMLGETPLSPSELAYLENDYILPAPKPECISSQIRFNYHTDGKAGFSLCHLADEQMGERSTRACEFTGFGHGRTSTEESK